MQVLLASVKQSVVQATVSTAVSLSMGLFFGTLLVIYSGRMKSTLISLLLVTYVLPGIIMSLGIISLFGFSSRFWEIIYGNVIYNAPMIAVLAFSTGYSTSIREVYSARTLGASDAQIITRFYLPNTLRGGLLGGIEDRCTQNFHPGIALVVVMEGGSPDSRIVEVSVVGRIRCIRVNHLSLAVLKETEGRIPAVTHLYSFRIVPESRPVLMKNSTIKGNLS